MAILERIAAYFSSAENRDMNRSVGRNDPCWCGSGKKYKKCHLHEDEKKSVRNCRVNCGPT